MNANVPTELAETAFAVAPSETRQTHAAECGNSLAVGHRRSDDVAHDLELDRLSHNGRASGRHCRADCGNAVINAASGNAADGARQAADKQRSVGDCGFIGGVAREARTNAVRVKSDGNISQIGQVTHRDTRTIGDRLTRGNTSYLEVDSSSRQRNPLRINWSDRLGPPSHRLRLRP